MRAASEGNEWEGSSKGEGGAAHQNEGREKFLAPLEFAGNDDADEHDCHITYLHPEYCFERSLGEQIWAE